MVDFSKYKKKEASEPEQPIEANIPETPILEPQEILLTHTIKDIKQEKKAQISSFVGMRNISHTPTTNVTKDNTIDICPMCNKRTKITQDKSMNKDEIIQWFSIFINRKKDNFTLDWLRGQKLTFESIYEMRK